MPPVRSTGPSSAKGTPMTSPQDPTPPGEGTPGGGYGTPGAGGPADAPGYPPPGQPGYGTPPPGQPGYGTPPAGYGAPGGAAPFNQPGGPQLAGWGDRAGGALIDWFGPSLVAGVIYQISTALGSLAYLAALGWALYNAYLQGNTGQSYGKKQFGMRLLREQDGQVIGGGLGIGRYFLHILDAIPCYIGFLWPIWDAKNQTFADKIVKTVVIKA
jgi:uncharacterized RDD family membrane protein YckC